MHRRKEYLIYPPNYVPGDGYQKRFSVLQAKKLCLKMGHGAHIRVSVFNYPAKFQPWKSCTNDPEKGWVYAYCENLSDYTVIFGGINDLRDVFGEDK